MMTMLHMCRIPFFHHEKHSGNIDLRKVSRCHYKTCVASTKIRWMMMITNVTLVQCITMNVAPPEHTPKKVVKYNKKKHKKSKWMTSALLKSINIKNQLYKKWIKTDVNNVELYSRLKEEFKSYYNTLRRSIGEAKRLYYTRTFAIYKNNIKQTWTIIKDTLQRKSKCEIPNQFFIGNRMLTDSDEIANEFNNYFVNIGRLLSEQITSPHTSEEYLGDRPNVSFKFSPVSEDRIGNIIKHLKSKSSYGYDEISNNLIKHASNSLIKPLTLIVNQVLHTGIFPRQLKLSRVKPVHKSGEQSHFCNYRPISLLPSMSKVFEYVIFDQLMTFLTDNKLFCMEQFGFRPGHSTELAALRLVDHLTTEMDNSNVPTNIYIDLSKAFDSLNHSILLKKLNHYGISGCSHKLFCSYLSDRSQYVDFNGQMSTEMPISTGVPQGSVLGPLLFLIYINDLPLVSNIFTMLMYADDTTLYCNVNNDVTDDLLNYELSKICDWLGANKLALNVSKTKFMVFHTINKHVIYPKLNINGNNIERVTNFNFLGLTLTSTLSWKQHINKISLKISKSIGVLYRLRDIYPRAVLQNLYNALILPQFNYCILCWGSVISENHSLHILQKKALRLITNSSYISHTEPLCKELRVLKVFDMFYVAVWKFYYKLMHIDLPLYFSAMKPTLPTVCRRYEIRTPMFHLPMIRHTFAEHSIRFCLINLLNKDTRYTSIMERMDTDPYHSFKFYMKGQVLELYQKECIIVNCYVCRRLKINDL